MLAIALEDRHRQAQGAEGERVFDIGHPERPIHVVGEWRLIVANAIDGPKKAAGLQAPDYGAETLVVECLLQDQALLVGCRAGYRELHGMGTPSLRNVRGAKILHQGRADDRSIVGVVPRQSDILKTLIPWEICRLPPHLHAIVLERIDGEIEEVD